MEVSSKADGSSGAGRAGVPWRRKKGVGGRVWDGEVGRMGDGCRRGQGARARCWSSRGGRDASRRTARPGRLHVALAQVKSSRPEAARRKARARASCRSSSRRRSCEARARRRRPAGADRPSRPRSRRGHARRCEACARLRAQRRGGMGERRPAKDRRCAPPHARAGGVGERGLATSTKGDGRLVLRGSTSSVPLGRMDPRDGDEGISGPWRASARAGGRPRAVARPCAYVFTCRDLRERAHAHRAAGPASPSPSSERGGPRAAGRGRQGPWG